MPPTAGEGAPTASASEAMSESAPLDSRSRKAHDDAGGDLRTREEKIADMDREFHESLARFEQDQRNADVTGAGGSNSAGGGATASGSAGAGVTGAGGTGDGPRAGGGRQSGQGEQGSQVGAKRNVAGASIESVPAAGMEGTRAPAEAPSAKSKPGGKGLAGGTASGQVPKDILALRRGGSSGPDNDSRLEAQIRRAAMNESDPEKKARLWNEYRRYKGLPLKPFTGDQDADAPESSE